MRNLKAAIFLQDVSGGGAERVLINLGNEFINQGVSVDFVLVRTGGAFEKKIDTRARVIPLRCRKVALSVFPLANYLRTHRPNFMVSALTHVNISAICAKLLSGSKCRVIVTEHSYISVARKKVKNRLVKASYWAMPHAYKFADSIVSVSEGVKENLVIESRMDPKRITTVYNAVVTPELHDLSKQPASHPWLDDKKHPVLCAVGRLAEEKDFGSLLRCLRIINDNFECRLLLIGDGPERSTLESRAVEFGVNKYVDFLGFKPNPYAFIARCDALVLSSVREGLPTVLIEAMACGVQVVSTDCKSGPAEILERGKLGRMAPVSSPELLANAVIETLRSPVASPETLIRSSQKYSSSVIAKKYLELAC